jgi:hypothetical protein
MRNRKPWNPKLTGGIPLTTALDSRGQEIVRDFFKVLLLSRPTPVAKVLKEYQIMYGVCKARGAN